MDRDEFKDFLHTSMLEILENQDDDREIKHWDIQDIDQIGFLSNPFGLYVNLDGKKFLIEITEDNR